MVSILIALLMGGLAGLVASLIVDRSGKGVLLNVLIGLVGAVIANFLAPLTGLSTDLTQISLGSFLVATLGAVVALLVYNALTKRKLR